MKIEKMVVTGMVLMGMAAGSGYAQDVPPQGPFGGAEPRAARRQEMRPRGGDRPGFNRMGMGSNEEMIFRLVRDPAVAKEIGITPEKAEVLKGALQKVQERQIEGVATSRHGRRVHNRPTCCATCPARCAAPSPRRSWA